MTDLERLQAVADSMRDSAQKIVGMLMTENCNQALTIKAQSEVIKGQNEEITELKRKVAEKTTLSVVGDAS